MRNNPIGVFDSGIGGLSVLYRCVELMPNERFIYLADKANMPYGNKSNEEIKRLALDRAATLFSMNCKAVVIACNTATVTAADDIRRLFSTRIVVGLEPAVKPCYRELGKTGYAVALVTDATYRSEKFARLISSCDGKIIPIARPELAQMIEDNASDIGALRNHVREIFCEYKSAEAVVLGCSHYAHITGLIRELFDGKIKIYDGAGGAAARLEYCLALSGLIADSHCTDSGGITFFSTTKYAKTKADD